MMESSVEFLSDCLTTWVTERARALRQGARARLVHVQLGSDMEGLGKIMEGLSERARDRGSEGGKMRSRTSVRAHRFIHEGPRKI